MKRNYNKMPLMWIEDENKRMEQLVRRLAKEFNQRVEQESYNYALTDEWVRERVASMMTKIYIRFGEIPTDERSNRGNGVAGDGYEVIGKEKGVSVWNAVLIDNKYHLVAPHPTQYTYGDFCAGAFPDNCYGCCKTDKIYVVTGNEVGRGADNEPLLRNVQIVKELPYDYFRRVEE